MANFFDYTTPAPQLTEDVLRKINALGHEPKVIIEFDKMSYIPGMKSRFEVWDRIYNSSIEYIASNSVVDSPVTVEPQDTVSGGESGDRFEYIKCAFNKWVKNYSLIDQAYYFLLAVAKHETGFGTLGQGRPEKGSFIVGYGCPGSCNNTYSGIDTQAKYAAKRYYDAMKSRMEDIRLRGYMTEHDINYFHEGGDKGMGDWVWSQDGDNWKRRVKDYYDSIISDTSGKYDCKEAGAIGGGSSFTAQEEDDVYTIEQQAMDSVGSVSAFPVEGTNFSLTAYVSSHHMRHRGGRSGHKGIDIVDQNGINGMWVVAAWDGYITRAEYSSSYGNVVYVKHMNGYETVYAHMQNGSLQVRRGQRVSAGDRLGRAGSTGNSTGPHLHFEVWKGSWTYGGTNHIDPYWILTGAQKVSPSSSSGEEQLPEMKVTTNLKFNKCFDKNANLDDNWTDKENAKHFTSATTGEKYLGFSGNVPQGGYSNFGYSHNFSADGYFEYSFFSDLKEGDEVVVTMDGMVVKRYTASDNTSKPTYEEPIYLQYAGENNVGANSHILDITIKNNSGDAVFGIKCFKVAEVDVAHGSSFVTYEITPRKRDEWMETGAFIYDDTFTLEEDILRWEVNTHYDMRSATASITLDNKHGIYSPTYERTTIFPDNRRESEMSYYEEGQIRHVLSEATPVRIYAGYGENLVRVFTGRIKGEVKQDSEAQTVTIDCVDMYGDLEEYVFDRILTFPRRDEIHGDETEPLTMWVKSSIVHSIVNESGLLGWRVHQEDLKYPDTIIEETYYIDIDRGGKKAVMWDAKKQKYVEKKIGTVKDAFGYKNPYVQSIDFPEGTRASDAIQQVIGDIMYRAYCDRYGTFRLENTRNINASRSKWEFIDGENLQSLNTSIDHSRVRNHLLVEGSGGQISHFIDTDLLVSTKGQYRTAKIAADWIDESYGSTARGAKEDVASKLFFDMKRMARTFNVVVKGNPMIEVLDGVYVYDRNTSSAGYFVVKGNRLVGDTESMVNHIELTWEDQETYKTEETPYWIPPETSPENVEGEDVVSCGEEVNAGNGRGSFTHSVDTNGYVYVKWDMKPVGDKMSIFVGGKLRYTTGEKVSNSEKSPIGFYYTTKEGLIEVKINDGVETTDGTAWDYVLYCPGAAPDDVVDKATLV